MKKGISLVALIITIIVLIILTSVVVFNMDGPLEEATYAKFANDVSVIQESITMNLLDNEARYAINEKSKLLRWVGIIDGYTEEMANQGIEPNFAKSTVVIQGNRVLKISSEMKKNINLSEVEFDNYYVDAKGKVYHVGFKVGDNTYYTVKENDPVPSNNAETTIISKDVEIYIIQGYIPIYTAEQFADIGSNIQNYEIRDLNDEVIKASGFNMNSDANYVLANNIDFTGYEVEPILEFSGIFDGNGYTISNIVIDNSNSASDFVPIEFATSTDRVKHPAALFEKLSDGAIVKQIYVNDISVKGDRTVAVIGGECNGSILVKDCHVTNVALEVYESSAIGGILAFAYNAGEEIIRVENCSIDNIEIVEQKNREIIYANIALKGYGGYNNETGLGYPNSAGIVSISKTNLEVVNCIVENSITASKELAAGIVYMQQGKSIYVENCVVEDTNLVAITESAGIVSIVKNTNIEITDCRCENININSSISGGVRGGVIAYCENTNAETFEITNCIVRNVDFVNGYDTGGIVGLLISKETAIINNCTVENCDIEVNGCQRGGIVAHCEAPIKMTGNIARNITMIGEGCAQGGCIGMLRYGVGERSTITDCNVDNITISGTACEAAGFIGYATNVDFINCHATNLNINTGNSGGGITGLLYNTSTITDCTVSDSVITSRGAQVGGFIGYTSSSVELLRCDSINNELNGICDSGGLIGILFNGARINECTVEYNEINSSCNVGAVVGLVRFSSGNLEIDNCSINNIHFNIAGDFGGIVGILETSIGSIVSITNCEVDTVIKSDLTEKNELIGGIIGLWRNSIVVVDTDLIENCTVSNITSSNYYRAGGIIGQLTSCNIDVVNCDVSNFIIDTVDYSLGGIVGTSGNSKLNVTDCTVTDVELTNATHHAGGIIGLIKAASTTNISGCTVTGLDIDAAKCGGGILGVIYETEFNATPTTKVSNLTIDQCVINGININAGECIGGIAGFLENNIATISGCALTNLTLNVGATNTGNIIAVSIATTVVNTNNTVN